MASLRDKVAEVAQRIGANPEDLWHVIFYESEGKANAVGPELKKGDKKRQPGVGLIQFMPDTAVGLGTTREALLKMSEEEQLPYVEKYFQDIKRRHKLDKFNLRQLYSSVLTGTPHASLDKGDGYRTVGQVVKTIEGRQQAEGGKKPVVQSVLDKLYGPAKEEEDFIPGQGPLKPEVVREAQHKQNPVSPLKPWHEKLQFDEGNIGEKTIQDAKDMGVAIGGGGEEKVEDPAMHDRAAWEFVHPNEPMPEGWSVEGNLRKLQAGWNEERKALEKERQALPPLNIPDPKNWRQKYGYGN